MGGGWKQRLRYRCTEYLFFFAKVSYFLAAGAAVDKAAEPSQGGAAGGAATVVKRYVFL